MNVALPRIGSEDELASLYGAANPTSLLKEIDHVSADYARFIAASPLVILSTSGPEGLDCSPRGDAPGFVRVADAKTLMIPDRRGNNRLDSLRNILRDPRVALLFVIPGIGETMRVNGRAYVTAAAELCQSFTVNDKVPQSVIVVEVERCYPQCQKALVRSKLWDVSQHLPRAALPTVGEMMARLDHGFDGAAYDAAYPERLKQTLY
jgi:PPOX class probable FMN-dependent enzyme